MEILRNNRGGPRLCAEGYSYTKKSSTRKKIRWQCSQRGAFSCNGCAFTDLEATQLLSVTDHCHKPDTNKIEAIKVKNNIKTTIASGNKTSSTHIVAEAICTQPMGIRFALGRFDSLKRNIQRLRAMPTNHLFEKFINRNANNVLLKPKATPTRFKLSTEYFKRATRGEGSIEEDISVEEEGTMQVDTTSVFRDIFPTDTFNSFEEFDFFFKKYQDRTGSVFRVKSSCSVIKENERRKQQISLKLKYATVSFVCVHYGSRKRQGLGIRRPKRQYLPCGCNVLVALSVRKNQLFITRTYLQHNHESKSCRPSLSKRKRTNEIDVTATVSSEDSAGQLASLFPPTAAKIQKKTESQFEKQCFEKKEPKTVSPPVQPSFPAPRQEKQVLLAPIQVAKQKPVESPRPKEKKTLFVTNHQRYVMSNLVSLWKSGKLCDASIGNGSSTVMMHKLVLSAMCPKLLSLSNTDIGSHEFLQVNFPSEVSKEALNAFAEYIYTGVLDLDPEILEQLKIIAKRLDMNEFERLCESHLSNNVHEFSSSSIDLSANTQTITPVPDMISSVDFPRSTFMQSASSIYTPVINMKQETSEDRLSLVEREPTAVLTKETGVSSLARNVSGKAVISPRIKTESIVSEDDKYGQRKSNQSFSSTSSSLFSSIASVSSSSSTEFAIPSSRATDIKSIRLKTPPHVSDSSPLETVGTQSTSMKKYSSKPSKSSSPFTIPKNSNAVYPIKLFINRGDKPPFLTTDSSDAMTDNSSIPSENT